LEGTRGVVGVIAYRDEVAFPLDAHGGVVGKNRRGPGEVTTLIGDEKGAASERKADRIVTSGWKGRTINRFERAILADMKDGYAVTPGVYGEKKGLLRIGDDLLVGV
jgi:hypothetical protein